MPPDLTPDSIRGAKFRTVLRGADQSEVEAFLSDLAVKVEALEADRARLAARLGDFADRDLKSEFESVGREVTAVLESAREAAETMRERASADAARWRSESMAESEKLKKDAKNDAEALRGDAWSTGTELLTQAVTEVDRLVENAERDAITITGEAEREAHRLVSSARREAEDMLRSAAMDAEKSAAEAERARDEMLEQARRQAEASQERTRALEQRREELMEELEGVRAALSQMEGTLEAKREDLNLSRTSDTSVRVVPSERAVTDEPEQALHWEPGETVRVIREEPLPTETLERPTAPEIEVEKPPPVASPTDSPQVQPEPEEPAKEPVAAPESPGNDSADDVDALFASLRTPDTGTTQAKQSTAETVPKKTQSKAKSATAAPAMRSADDLIENRDAALLPISNRALRGIKKAVTDAQNIALDGLRTSAEWKPDQKSISETLRADLITLWAESYSAGHDSAETMAEKKLKRPATPSTDAAEEFGAALVSALKAELESAGDGQRERQSAASRVFRGWRTDEAERRIHHLSLAGFHKGFVDSAKGETLAWVPSGNPCSACREAASDPGSNPPPIHPGCECTLAI